MKDTRKSSPRQPEYLFTMTTRSPSFSRSTTTLTRQFKLHASKLALQIHLHLLEECDPRFALLSQSVLAKELKVASSHVSNAYAELVRYGIIVRCRVKDEIEYFFNPELYWAGNEEDRQARIKWLKIIEEPGTKRKYTRKKQPPIADNVVNFPQPKSKTRK